MGAKTGFLVHADGDVPGLLREVGTTNLERTTGMMRRLYPGWGMEESGDSTLRDGVYPRRGRCTRRAGPAWRSPVTGG